MLSRIILCKENNPNNNELNTELTNCEENEYEDINRRIYGPAT